jgi:tripartite-type tricarboxylate transporter receptor subunit TctC
MKRRTLLTATAAGAVLGPSALLSTAQAQMINRPARLFVGFPPGGAADIVARRVADRLRGLYAPTVLVENRPGAAARIAIEGVKNADPDGTTILFTPATMITLFPHVFTKLSYDPSRDLRPVSTVCTFDLGMAVGPGTPAKTLEEFVAWCKANPKQASFGTPGAGSGTHFLGMMLGRSAGFEFQHVPYKGAAVALPDLVGGRVPAYVGVLSDMIQLHRSGKARILATSGRKRFEQLPEVPTFEEAGYRGVVVQEWFGLFLPGKTAPDIVQALNKATQDVVADPEFITSLANLNFTPHALSTAAFAERIRTETEEWGPVVKASGFKVEE